MNKRVKLEQLATGIRGLDDVLGGGIPELSFNLIVGGVGAGKTTLAHQIMFALATPERQALYITALGESPLKMLRYQQQFSFFDAAKLSTSVRYLHAGDELMKTGVEAVLTRILAEVEATSPGFVFVDSFRELAHRSRDAEQTRLSSFVERLSIHLTTWEATTFLVGECEEYGGELTAIFTVADGILWLSQVVSRNSVVRKLRIVKLRGQAAIPGLHTMKLSESGVRVYPRLPRPPPPASEAREPQPRRRTGVSGLDDMLGGGIPAGYSVMIVGPSGSGKTVLSTQFVREGIRGGERCVIAVFEKRPEHYLTMVHSAPELQRHVTDGLLTMLYLRPLDLSVDETMEELAEAVKATGATRVVIDSLMGFELALAQSFREDFRESLYRMVGGLVGLGVTVMMTAELDESYTDLRLSPHEVSFLTDGIILQRYVEITGQLRKVIAVVKMRGYDHQKDLRFYDIGPDGIVIGEPAADYQGLLVGRAQRVSSHSGEPS
ncbi:MAG TPA: ATPase domain-containing protein [Kofleriaceae bacterium]|nr:ATPase domain-containing protein [Kofleriaceae bacterium]